jgi:hypothetical protein
MINKDCFLYYDLECVNAYSIGTGGSILFINSGDEKNNGEKKMFIDKRKWRERKEGSIAVKWLPLDGDH